VIRQVAVTVDAVVIGAGPGGSAAACALAAAGWETVILERRAAPRPKVCGEFLSPEAGATLRELGLMDAVSGLAPVRIGRVRLSAAGGEPLEVPLPAPAYGVGRRELDEALLEGARRAGAQVRAGTRATGIRREGGMYAVEARGSGGEETIRARVVIGAWGAGARSAFADPRAARRPASRLLGVKVHLEGAPFEPVTELYAFRGGYLGLSPVPGGRINAAALLDPRAFGGGLSSAMDWIAAAADRHPDLGRRLAGARPMPGTGAAVSPVRPDARPLAWAGCPLVGDAALRIPPLCGDGMSIALRSGLVCARLADRHLRGGMTEEAWRREYGRFFRRECAGALRLGRLLQTAFGLPWAARLLFAAGRAMPAWAAAAVRRTRLAEPES
jgi:flavin-dependent dehydrogenase